MQLRRVNVGDPDAVAGDVDRVAVDHAGEGEGEGKDNRIEHVVTQSFSCGKVWQVQLASP